VRNILVLIVVWLSFCRALTKAASEPKPITAAVGEEFEIVLESPSGSDCQWLLSKPLDETRLKTSGQEYKRRLPGRSQALGCEVLRFTALSEGKVQIHFRYGSLWEKGNAQAPTTNFVVVITRSVSRRMN
jgi:predicted secreted protein